MCGSNERTKEATRKFEISGRKFVQLKKHGPLGKNERSSISFLPTISNQDVTFAPQEDRGEFGGVEFVRAHPRQISNQDRKPKDLDKGYYCPHQGYQRRRTQSLCSFCW